MRNWCGRKKMNSWSPESEELKIPVLENTNGPTKRRVGSPFMDCVGTSVCIASGIFVLFFIVIPIIAAKKDFTTYKPEIRLDSLIFCTTNTSSNLVIWDLKLDITNTNNYSGLCIYPFEVSIFSSFHQNKLLTTTNITQTCVDPENRTSAKGFADVSLLDPNDDLDRTNETIRFDLKIHGHFWFSLLPYRADYGVDLVCKDAKVALLTSYNSSCASIIGDPFTCSYV